MTKEETRNYIRSDIFRNKGEYNGKIMSRVILGYDDTVSLLYYFRWCHYYCTKERKHLIDKLCHGLCYINFKKLQKRCGVEMNQHMDIGHGLRLPHSGSIILHPQVVIGNNCEIMQGVTIGNNIMKSRDDVPVIGNEVLICAGATVIGGIKVGDTVIIGANSLVNKDVADGTMVGGVPAKPLGACDDRFVINRHESMDAC